MCIALSYSPWYHVLDVCSNSPPQPNPRLLSSALPGRDLATGTWTVAKRKPENWMNDPDDVVASSNIDRRGGRGGGGPGGSGDTPLPAPPAPPAGSAYRMAAEVSVSDKPQPLSLASTFSETSNVEMQSSRGGWDEAAYAEARVTNQAHATHLLLHTIAPPCPVLYSCIHIGV